MGAKWGAVICRHEAALGLLQRSILTIYQVSCHGAPRRPTVGISFASRGFKSPQLHQRSTLTVLFQPPPRRPVEHPSRRRPSRLCPGIRPMRVRGLEQLGGAGGELGVGRLELFAGGVRHVPARDQLSIGRLRLARSPSSAASRPAADWRRTACPRSRVVAVGFIAALAGQAGELGIVCGNHRDLRDGVAVRTRRGQSCRSIFMG